MGQGIDRPKRSSGKGETRPQSAAALALRPDFAPARYNLADTSRRLGRTQEGCPSRRPIFVVGMPRSGTTLVEQILAAHPAVVGAGELKELGLCLDGWIEPQAVDLSVGKANHEHGEDYVAAIKRSADAIASMTKPCSIGTPRFPGGFMTSAMNR